MENNQLKISTSLKPISVKKISALSNSEISPMIEWHDSRYQTSSLLSVANISKNNLTNNDSLYLFPYWYSENYVKIKKITFLDDRSYLFTTESGNTEIQYCDYDIINILIYTFSGTLKNDTDYIIKDDFLQNNKLVSTLSKNQYYEFSTSLNKSLIGIELVINRKRV